jgi:hypothetical protein
MSISFSKSSSQSYKYQIEGDSIPYYLDDKLYNPNSYGLGAAMSTQGRVE